MSEQLFLYGVYCDPRAPTRTAGRALGRRIRNPSSRQGRADWTTVGGDDGLSNAADAIDRRTQQAVADIDAGAGIPKPRTFP